MAKSRKTCDGPRAFPPGHIRFLYSILRDLFPQQRKEADEQLHTLELGVRDCVRVVVHLPDNLALPQHGGPDRPVERTLVFIESYTERAALKIGSKHHAGVHWEINTRRYR